MPIRAGAGAGAGTIGRGRGRGRDKWQGQGQEHKQAYLLYVRHRCAAGGEPHWALLAEALWSLPDMTNTAGLSQQPPLINSSCVCMHDMTLKPALPMNEGIVCSDVHTHEASTTGGHPTGIPCPANRLDCKEILTMCLGPCAPTHVTRAM